MNPLTILHLTHQYPPEEMGGVEIHTRDLAREQAKLGHRVSVIVPSQRAIRGGLNVTVEAGVRVVRVPIGRRNRARIFAATWYDPTFLAAFKARLHAVDLVHMQHLMGIPVEIVALLHQRNIPYVITLHDYWFPCINAQLVTNYDETVCAGPDAKWHNCGRCFVARAGGGDRPKFAPIIAPLLKNRHKRLKHVFDHAAAVISVSHFVKEKYAQLGFAGEHVQVVPTGIEIPEQLKRGRKEMGEQFHVVYVGSVAPPKGVHVLIEAFNGLSAAAKLTIAGGLEKFPDYVAQLKAAVRHPNVHLVGRLGRDAVWELLGSAEISVLPTLWYEASPLTISEFFAAGLPIIASDIGAVAERIRHNHDGLLFPPNDAPALHTLLANLYNDRAQLQHLQQNIPPVTTIAQYVSQIEAVYRALVGKEGKIISN